MALTTVRSITIACDGSGDSRHQKLQEIALQEKRLRIRCRHGALPAGPGFRDQAGFRLSIGPSATRFLAHCNGACRYRPDVFEWTKAPFEECGFKRFCDRFRGLQQEQPVVSRRCGRIRDARRRGADADSVIASDAQCLVDRAVVDNQDLIAGMQGFQSSSQTKLVVVRLKDGRDEWHARRAWDHNSREVGNS